jgi:hypothetical protein
MSGILNRFLKEETPITNKLTYCYWMNRNKKPSNEEKKNVLL